MGKTDVFSIEEKFYCVLEDLKDYNQNLRDAELDCIIFQLEMIKEDILKGKGNE